MRAPFTQLYAHLVWSTWNRLPLITPAVKGQVIGSIRAKCREMGAEVIAIEAMTDHLHLLARLPASVAISALVKETKAASSHLVTHVVAPGTPFRWQGAFGASSVSPKDVEAITSYVNDQQQHHSDGSLRFELESSSVAAEEGSP